MPLLQGYRVILWQDQVNRSQLDFADHGLDLWLTNQCGQSIEYVLTFLFFVLWLSISQIPG